MKKIDFFRPQIDEKEKELIRKALENPNNIDMVIDFEDEIKKYFGVKYTISTNNSTAAKHLALCAMDIKRGDKIICSVNSFPNVAEVIRHFDAEPIFVDINEDDFNINPQKFENVVKANKSKKLKCAFINHMAGQSSDMDAIYDIANRYEMDIIDDGNMALGTTYKGKKIGSMSSKISCFKINAQFNINVATAGFMLTNDDEIAKRALLLRNHGIVNNSSKSDNLGYIYDIIDIGIKYSLCTIDAAFCLAQFRKVDSFIKKRIEIAQIYNKFLKDCPHIEIPVNKGEHAYYRYIIKVDKNRDSFARDLADLGVSTSLHYIPLHLLSYYKNKYNLKVNAFPSALKTYQVVLSLPIYADLKSDEIEYICDSVLKTAKSRV